MTSNEQELEQPVSPVLDNQRDSAGRFIKGVSGNPDGRPRVRGDVPDGKRKTLTGALREAVDPEEWARIGRKWMYESFAVWRYVGDRLEGYPAQRQRVDLNETLDVKLSWADGTPVFQEPDNALPSGESEVIEGSATIVDNDNA